MASASRRQASISIPSNSCPRCASRKFCKICSTRRRPAGRASLVGFAARPKRWRPSIAPSANACGGACALSRRNRSAHRGSDWLAAHRLDLDLYVLSRQRTAFGRAGVRGRRRGPRPLAPYYSLENVDHAFCNAHLLRELQPVCEFDKEPWAEVMRATLLDANEAVREAKEKGASALAPATIEAFEDRYWAAVREGLALHRSLPDFDPSKSPSKRRKQRPAHNLLLRFKTFRRRPSGSLPTSRSPSPTTWPNKTCE